MCGDSGEPNMLVVQKGVAAGPQSLKFHSVPLTLKSRLKTVEQIPTCRCPNYQNHGHLPRSEAGGSLDKPRDPEA